ncbi:MAG: hypothetical protein ABW164_01025 [Sphingobium sp.]
MRILLPLLLALPACSKGESMLEDLPNSSLAGAQRDDPSESRMEASESRAVTIGEDGPRLDACGTMGQVVRVGTRGLAVRAAPFASAPVTVQLAEASRMHVCTRSIDQKWLGIVVPGEGEAADCGVSEPVDRKQPYDGPCRSGWVSSASVRLIAG